MIYLDNAATSFPKNEAALRQALEQYLTLGASPGRGGYDRAVEAEALVSGARRAIADFFGAPADSRVIFAANATDALNTLIQGLAGEGAHVLSTRLEHNSVLRPLHHMRRKGGLDFDLLAFDTQGYLDPLAVREGLRTDSTAVVMTHASNVLGTVQPVEEIGDMLRKRQGQKVALCVDASQSAGVIPIDMQAANISALAFTGHKSLGGPTGIGALVLAPDLDLQPSRFGGTGVDSKNLFQPDEYPARLESGTQNMLGILALHACLRELTLKEQQRRLAHEMGLLRRLYDGLSALSGITVYGGRDMERQVPLLSCTLEGMVAADVGAILDGDFEIAVRTGLHCAPLVHESLGTAPQGSVRFSLGSQNTPEQIDAAIRAMREIVQSIE